MSNTSNKRTITQVYTNDEEDLNTKLETLTTSVSKLTTAIKSLEYQSDTSTNEQITNRDKIDDLTRKIDHLTHSFQNLRVNDLHHPAQRNLSAQSKQQTFITTISQTVTTARRTDTSAFQPPVLTNYITDTITTLTIIDSNNTSNIPYVLLWEAYRTYRNDSSFQQSLKTRTRKAFINLLLQGRTNDQGLNKILKRTDLFAIAQRCYLFASLFPGNEWRDAFDPKQMKHFKNNEVELFCFQFENSNNLMI